LKGLLALPKKGKGGIARCGQRRDWNLCGPTVVGLDTLLASVEKRLRETGGRPSRNEFSPEKKPSGRRNLPDNGGKARNPGQGLKHLGGRGEGVLQEKKA